MKNVLTVIKKEFARFFRDRRLVIGTLILPAVLIFALYSLMGSIFYDESDTYSVRVVNPSALFMTSVEQLAQLQGESVFDLTEIPAGEAEAAKADVRAGRCDLLIVFPEGFDEAVLSVNILPVGEAPNVELWFDPVSTASSSAYNAAYSLLDKLEDGVSNLFDMNYSAGGSLVTDSEAEASMYAMLLPFLILTFLYSGCMGIAPESIAGEKERGTIATLLVTPIRRGELVVGKILSLSAISALSAISSFIGTFLAMPQIMGGSIGDAIAAYSVWQYLALFAVMISAVLLIVTLISIISSYARGVKEATSFSVPLMIVVMLVGLSTMLFTVSPSAHAAFLIPIYNCVQVMAEIFSLEFSAANLLIALASNLVYIVLLVWLLARMFRSERVIFNP